MRAHLMALALRKQSKLETPPPAICRLRRTQGTCSLSISGTRVVGWCKALAAATISHQQVFAYFATEPPWSSD